jgi:hypothetical protein
MTQPNLRGDDQTPTNDPHKSNVRSASFKSHAAHECSFNQGEITGKFRRIKAPLQMKQDHW